MKQESERVASVGIACAIILASSVARAGVAETVDSVIDLFVTRITRTMQINPEYFSVDVDPNKLVLKPHHPAAYAHLFHKRNPEFVYTRWGMALGGSRFEQVRTSSGRMVGLLVAAKPDLVMDYRERYAELFQNDKGILVSTIRYSYGERAKMSPITEIQVEIRKGVKFDSPTEIAALPPEARLDTISITKVLRNPTDLSTALIAVYGADGHAQSFAPPDGSVSYAGLKDLLPKHGFPSAFPIASYLKAGTSPVSQTAEFSHVIVCLHYNRNHWVRRDIFEHAGPPQRSNLEFRILPVDETFAPIDDTYPVGYTYKEK